MRGIARVYSLPWSTFGSEPSVVQRIVLTPEPVSAAAKLTRTVFLYGSFRQDAPLQRTVSVGAVASGTRENDAAPELSPAAFVAVIVSGPAVVVPVLLETYVRCGPDPAAVKPGTLGKE